MSTPSSGKRARKRAPVAAAQAPRQVTNDEHDPRALHARIAATAYLLFERRGRQHGQHLEDWLAAEEMILRDAPSISR